MIDFSNDGPFALDRSEPSPHHATFGLGTAGVRILDQIQLQDADAKHLYIIDTDEQSVRASVVREKFLLGQAKLRGMGCGGDEELAAALWKGQVAEIKEMIAGVETAFVVTALGGGTGSGCASELVRLLKSQGVKVMAFVVMPFEFEGTKKSLRAHSALSKLRDEADACFVFSNNRILHLPETSEDIRFGLQSMNMAVADWMETCRAFLGGAALSHVSWEDLQVLAPSGQTGHENAWSGFGSGRGDERVQEAVHGALESALLDDGTAWERADQAFAGLVGGGDFSMAEYQQALRILKKELPDGMSLHSGALINSALQGELRMTLFFSASHGVGSEQEEIIPASVTPLKTAGFHPVYAHEDAAENVVEELSSRTNTPNFAEVNGELDEHRGHSDDLFETMGNRQQYFAQQEELQLDQRIHRGRFEKSERTIHGGQDLDLPTFQRLKIAIRL